MPFMTFILFKKLFHLILFSVNKVQPDSMPPDYSGLSNTAYTITEMPRESVSL